MLSETFACLCLSANVINPECLDVVSLSCMHMELHNSYGMFKNECHVIHITQLSAIFVLFATFMLEVFYIFLIETSKFTHMCIYILCIYT